jgi:hypothetical protein
MPFRTRPTFCSTVSGALALGMELEFVAVAADKPFCTGSRQDSQ